MKHFVVIMFKSEIKGFLKHSSNISSFFRVYE